ncbi:MAG: hypothetical protein IKN39_03610 [Clostridia bacterium]|nr:hypothetical protein [Clostridia bacterium]
MSMLKEYEQIAFQIMVEIGAIKTCSIHDDFYYNTYKYEEKNIYALATAKLKEQYGELQDFETFHKQIDEILSYAAGGEDECPYCKKLQEE